MRIAIVGGLGFIGTNLYKYLKKKKLNVKILDNLKIKNNHKYISKKDIIFCDTRIFPMLEKKLINFEFIINLAGQTGVLESDQKPNYCISQNIVGFSNILNVVKKRNKKIKIINASTGGAIYGDNTKFSTEESNKFPISYYGLSKKFNEDLSNVFFKLYKIETVNLRFSNVYGEYSFHKKSFIHNCIKNILSNKKTKIFGDGKQTRDFIYVQDLVKLIYRSFKLKHGSYNIASGKSFSVNQILNIMINIKKNFKFKYTKKNLTEVKDVKISNSKIKKILRLKKNFFTPLNKGINKTLDWYQKIT